MGRAVVAPGKLAPVGSRLYIFCRDGCPDPGCVLFCENVVTKIGRASVPELSTLRPVCLSLGVFAGQVACVTVSTHTIPALFGCCL